MSSDAVVHRLSDGAYLPSPTVATEVRHALRDLLTAWDVSDALLSDTLLIVEEFVANVVDHAGTAFEITVERRGAVLRVAVRDHSDRAAAVRSLDPTAVRGRGLQLVSAVADDWGCDWHTTGKTVWARLAA